MKRSRRTTRIPDSHPGLFDAIDGAEPFGMADIVAEAVERIRAREAAEAVESLALPRDATERAEKLCL